MTLQSVAINNFRSIEHLRLSGCRDVNVLIGKNNAGKSTILSAISTVFNSIRGGRVIVPNPEIGKELNFFEKNTSTPIEITLAFSLTPSEKDLLIQGIAAAAPHMKNAAEGFEIDLWLKLTLLIIVVPGFQTRQ